MILVMEQISIKNLGPDIEMSGIQVFYLKVPVPSLLVRDDDGTME